MARLTGKVAIISGAGNGMGADEAQIFAREGAKVIIADRSETEGKAQKETIEVANGVLFFCF